jgi:hypothetical protein
MAKTRSPAPSVIFDAEYRRVLEAMVDAVLPLNFSPANQVFIPIEATGKLPWRQSEKRLNAKSLKVVDFLERFCHMEEHADTFRPGDETTVKRWRKVGRDPVGAMLAWAKSGEPSLTKKKLLDRRAARGLESDASRLRFAPELSDNSPVLEVDRFGQKAAGWRAEFYRVARGPVLEAHAKATAAGRTMAAFVEGLFHKNTAENEKVDWPAHSELSAHEFIVRLTQDALVACMNMDDYLPDRWYSYPADERHLWRAAVMIELGEHRRPGNAASPADLTTPPLKHTAQHAADAVAAFVKKLEPSP